MPYTGLIWSPWSSCESYMTWCTSSILGLFPGRLPICFLTTHMTFEPAVQGHVCGQENGARDSLVTRLVVYCIYVQKNH